MKETIPHDLLQAYFAGTADEQQVAALSAWVEASPEHAAYLSSMGWLDLALKQELQNQAVDSLSARERAFLDRVDPDAWELILNSALSARHEREELEHAADPKPAPRDPLPPIRIGEVFAVAGNLAMMGLRTRAGAIGSIAAVLVLGAALYLAFTGPGGTPEPKDLADQTPARPDTQPATPVATLASESGAQWQVASGLASPGVGSALVAGQRLTLTSGSAEMVTRQGATLILQGPCTVELTDRPNVILLHAGKLVGICETRSSKGLVVRTPYLEVTDLGTRFGVEVAPGFATEVHVHQGQVRVAPPKPADAAPAQGRLVQSHQAVRADAISSDLMTIRPAFEKFSDRLATRRLFSTGFDLPEGSRDPAWQIVADGKGPLDQPIPLIVQHGERPDNHFPARGNDPAKAQWLVFAPGYPLYGDPRRPDLDRRTLTVQCRFDLPESVSLENAAVVLQYASGFGLTELRINGTPVQTVPPETNADRRQRPYREIELPAHTTSLRPGENIIEIDVPQPKINTQAPLVIYFNAELRPSPAISP